MRGSQSYIDMDSTLIKCCGTEQYGDAATNRNEDPRGPHSIRTNQPMGSDTSISSPYSRMAVPGQYAFPVGVTPNWIPSNYLQHWRGHCQKTPVDLH